MFVSPPAQNNHNFSNFNHDNKNFENRIAKGTDEGNLTAGEDSHLNKEMTHFDHSVAKDQAQGMTPQDRAKLTEQAQDISHNIYGLRHNDIGTMGPTGPAQDPVMTA